MAADFEHLSSWFGDVRRERSTAESTWEDIASFCLPERRGFIAQTHTEGQKRTERQFSQIGTELVNGLATNLTGLVFPHETQWFSLELPNEERADLPEEWQTWLEQATDAVWDDFYNPASGGGSALESALTDMCGFGPAPLLVLENGSGDPDFKVRSLDLANTYVDTDADNIVNALFCRESLSARQVLSRFGRAKLPENVAAELDNSRRESRKKFEIISAFYDREVYGEAYDRRRKDGQNKPWAYCVWENGEKGKIEESGFAEQPYVFARYKKIVGEKYAWSPAQGGLPEIKSFNQMSRAIIESAAFAARFPIATPNDGVFNMDRLRPGGEVNYDIETAKLLGRIPIEPLNVGGNFRDAASVMEMIQKFLEATFLKPLFALPIEGPQMTATEVIVRKQQFIQQVGPVYSNIEADLAQPLINRCAGIKLAKMRQRGELLPPEGLTAHLNERNKAGQRPLRIQFSSPVQRAIDDVRSQLLAMTMASLQPAIALNLQVADNLDLDQATRDTVGWKGAPANWLVKIDERDAGRQQKAQAAQAQQAGQQALEAAKVAPGMEKASPGIVPQLLSQAGLGVPTQQPPLGGIPE